MAVTSSAPRPDDPPAFPVLIGDIGGTNARFAIIAEPHAEPELFPHVPTASFPSIEAAIADVTKAVSGPRPRSAVIDIAGPVVGDEVALTNAVWVLRPREIMRATGMADVILLNDFEALAMALPELTPGDLAPIGGGRALSPSARVAIGPGTGLGVGALIAAAGLTVPVPGEGGHVAMGPVEADEFELWPNIEPEHGRISAEALLAGRGIVRLYRAVAHTAGAAIVHDDPAEITEAALASSDPTAVRTMEVYCRLLGRLAGDVALTFMARGGVFIGGGIPPRIVPLLQSGGFRSAFEAKAPHDDVMAQIPVWVITRDNAALPGLAAFASDPRRFGVTLEGRRWRAE